MKMLVAATGSLVVLLLLAALATWLITRRIETHYPAEGRFVDLAGGRMHYVDAGPRALSGEMTTGPPKDDAAKQSLMPPRATIVFLHGASNSHADPMVAVGNRLAERHRVISFDRPGHGWSDRIAGRAAASPVRQADIIAEALVSLGIERAIVVAHSWAGAVLPNLALAHSGMVAGAVYLAPVTHPWPGGGIAWYYGPAASSWFGWLMTRTITTPIGMIALDTVVRAVFAPKDPPPDYADVARIALTLRPSVFQANAEEVAGLYDAVSAQQRRYRHIRVPTIIISGDADDIIWTELHSRRLAREVPGAQLIILHGVGHMPHHAAPDLVIAEIERLADTAATAE